MVDRDTGATQNLRFPVLPRLFVSHKSCSSCFQRKPYALASKNVPRGLPKALAAANGAAAGDTNAAAPAAAAGRGQGVGPSASAGAGSRPSAAGPAAAGAGAGAVVDAEAPKPLAPKKQRLVVLQSPFTGRTKERAGSEQT